MVKIKHIVISIGIIILILGNISVLPIIFNGTRSEFNIYLNDNILNLLSFVVFILTSICLVAIIIFLLIETWDEPINLKKLIKK